MKFVGEEYHAFSEMWVDITCLKCSDSTDIRVVDLNNLISKINKDLYRKKSEDAKTQLDFK
jgi:hypothetical protein